MYYLISSANLNGEVFGLYNNNKKPLFSIKKRYIKNLKNHSSVGIL